MVDLVIHRDQLALHLPPEGVPIRPTRLCQAVHTLSSEIPGISPVIRKINYGANDLFQGIAVADRTLTGRVEKSWVPEFLVPYAKWLVRGLPTGIGLALTAAGVSRASKIPFKTAFKKAWSGTSGIWIAAFLTTTNIIASAHQIVNLIDPDGRFLNGKTREAVNTACNLLVVGASLWLISRPGAYSAVTRLPGALGDNGLVAFRSRPLLGRLIRQKGAEGNTSHYLDPRLTALLLGGWFAYIGYWNTVRTQEQNLVRREAREPGAGLYPANWRQEYHNLQPAVSEVAAWAGFADLWGGYLFQWGTAITSLITRRIPGIRFGSEILKTSHFGKRLGFSLMDLPISMALAIVGLQASQIARNYGSDEAVSLTSNRALLTMTIMTFVKNLTLARFGFVPSILLYSTTMWINSPWASCTEANQTFFQNADYTAGLYKGAAAASDRVRASEYAVRLFNQHRVATNDLPPGLESFAEEWNQSLYPDYLAIKKAEKREREAAEAGLRFKFSVLADQWGEAGIPQEFDIVDFFRTKNFEKWDVRRTMEEVGLDPDRIEDQAI